MQISQEDLEAQHCTDPIDRASSESDFAVREARLAQERQAAAEMPRPLVGEDGLPTGDCLDCGDPVEPERIKLELGRCYSCACAKEARQGRHQSHLRR